MKLETLKRRLEEFGFTFETGRFETERGAFAVKLTGAVDKWAFIGFCTKYQIEGIREGRDFFCYYLPAANV
jgi:hypothetical protein